MDLAPEELQFLTISDILRESISIPKRSPKTFYLITVALIFPLSFAILAHSLFTHPILEQLESPYNDPSQTSHEWTLLLVYQFCYLIFLFAFSLLSTAAVVFTVASLYTAKPVSFSSTMSAIPKVLKRLFITFLWVSLLMIVYNFVFVLSLVLMIIAIDLQNSLLLFFALIVILLLFMVAHVYITALWHLASVVSVLEPVYGFTAMRKSYELLKGRTKYASFLVFVYLICCGMIGGVFSSNVVHGGDDYSLLTRIVVGGFLVGLLVIVNLVGLLVQSVFYYVCKSYHHQGIDKTALHDHLGGYLGEYVPLKSSIQMEDLAVIPDILRESISIPKRSPKTFYLITISLIFPLSFAILAHSLFTHPLLSQLQSPYDDPSQTSHEWTLLLVIQFCYLIFLFAFSLLSTAAVVFTVASLYTSKPVSFSSTISAIPRVFKRLFITFLWVSLLMIAYNFIFVLSLVLLIVAIDTHNSFLLFFAVLVIGVLFLGVHVYITALWHLASVVSVLEPLYGFAAMKKSYELLKGRTKFAAIIVFVYLICCGVIGGVFSAVVVHGGGSYGVFTRIVVGGFLVGVLVIVNLVGLLVQSVFYYVCKSYHHQGIDKLALNDHLGGYLGEYVPLKSSIQMENLDV
ncbi:putative transmembrane protein [Senna tora]|uniref:Putative transmembrane protein n=1 Tax=Senna tora TaxID=362788 RepID=A0A834XDG5_9FABA|nr:putative transmembrane protein [Senna tora]